MRVFCSLNSNLTGLTNVAFAGPFSLPANTVTKIGYQANDIPLEPIIRAIQGTISSGEIQIMAMAPTFIDLKNGSRAQDCYIHYSA